MVQKLARTFLLLPLIFLLSFQVISDPDFGWHLRLGEYILNRKAIPASDAFSFTLPKYPYVYHSWAGETTTALSYDLAGLIGVSAMFATVLAASIFLIYKSTQIISKGRVSLVLLVTISPLLYAVTGGRMRSFGFLFLSLINYLLIKFEYQSSMKIFFIPLAILLWANFHGSFPVGILTISIFLILEKIAPSNKITKGKNSTLLKVLMLSLFASLINPYGISSWQHAAAMFTYSAINLSTVNPDWQSALSSNLASVFIMILASIVVFSQLAKKNNLSLLQKTLLALFFFLSLLSSKFLFALLIFLTPASNEILQKIMSKLNPKTRKALIIKLSLVILFLTLILISLKNLNGIGFAYSSTKNYASYLAFSAPTRNNYPPWSYEANLFLEKNFEDSRVLNEGNWGGLMLLVNPKRKLFYYSAMDNYIVGRQSFAFEYLKIIQAQDNWEKLIKKFGINAVFLPPNYPIVQKLKSNPSWNIAYEDKFATILVKN